MEVWRVVPDAHDEAVMCVACNRARSELYSGGQDGLVKLWSLVSGLVLRVWGRCVGSGVPLERGGGGRRPLDGVLQTNVF